MENLIVAINCVTPVFLVICTGALIRNSNRVPEAVFNHLSTIAFYFLLPCLQFHAIYTTDLRVSFNPTLIVYQALFLLAWYLVGFVFFSKFVTDFRVRGAMLQTLYRSNIGIIGLSMADSMLGATGVAAMAMTIAVIVPLYNILAVISLEVCRGETIDLRTTLVSIIKNPLIITSIMGIVFLLVDISIPGAVVKAIDQLGDTGCVVSLLSLGASLKVPGLVKNWKKLIFANLLRLVIAPFFAILMAILLGFRDVSLSVVLLSSAPALATNAYPMAIAGNSDHELTGQIVVTTSFFCCITMFIWIFVLKQTSLI